nr:minor capsid protein [Lactiplantibacillus pentosus]
MLTNQLADVIVRDSDQYVPFLGGYLAGHVSRIKTGTGVTIVWSAPYAAYMYGGKVMVKAPGTQGQRSGYHKVVTDRPLNYNHTKHTLAQKGWVDKAYLVNGHNWAALVARGLGAT